MKTNLHRVNARIQLRMSDHPTTITMRWTEMSGSTIDPLSQRPTGTQVNKTKVLNGQFHEVGPATSGLRLYSEIQIGDAIVDFPPDVQIDGKANTEFEINGKVWIQKDVGDTLSKAWDVFWNDQRFTRTVLLTQKPRLPKAT